MSGNHLDDALLKKLEEKSRWVWRETLLIHKRAPETRVASSLSPVEIFVCLYYGGILRFDPKNPDWDGRDRFIISKGHGSISMYPILADLGFFSLGELEKVCQEGSFLGGIPDPVIPGYETVNGSLGHGAGVGCGMALGLKRKKSDSHVFVIVGDGELCEGSNWEAVMFAGHHKLDNLTIIVDHNRISMLNYSKNIINMDPIADKFKAFGWTAEEVDGHNITETHAALMRMKNNTGAPKVLVANTVKGKGAGHIENHPLSHVANLKPEIVDSLVAGQGVKK
jgi:transketolase